MMSAMAKPHDRLRVPYFGDYVLFDEVGRGGMGVVYDAQQVSLDRRVALKLFADNFAASEKGINRLRLEAESIARLEHPNIISIYEVGEHAGQPYLAMQFVEGESLAERTARPDLRPAERDCGVLMSKIARAVHHAHERGVLHRDLKPGNIIVDGCGEPHLVDFGLAKCLEQDSDITQTGAFLGSPSYASPEQAAGCSKLVTTASDVFSLGAVFYALLTGKPPFVGGSPAATIEKVRNSDPIKPSSIRPTLAPDLETICLKCLQKVPERRYGTALALAEDLERFLEGKPITARPVIWPERMWMWARRNPALATLSLTASLALMAAVAGVLWAWKGSVARESLQSCIIGMRSGDPRTIGWSAAVSTNLARAKFIRDKNYFRDQAAASLEGLDSVLLAQRPTELLQQLMFVGDGDDLLLSGWSGSATWRIDERTGSNSLANLPAPGRPVACPSGVALKVIQFPSGQLGVWHSQEGRVLCNLEPLPGGAREQGIGRILAAASVDGQRLLLALPNDQGKITLVCWAVPEGRLLRAIEVESVPTALALSPNGSSAAWGDTNGRITLFDVNTGAELSPISVSLLRVSCLAFGPSAQRPSTDEGRSRACLLAAGDEGGSIGIWNLADYRPIALCRGGHYQVTCLAFSPDLMILAAGGRGPARIFDVATGKPLLSFDIGDQYECLAFNRNGTRLAASARMQPDSRVYVWELQNGRGIKLLRGLSSGVTKVAFSRDSERLAAISMGWQLAIWDLRRNCLLRLLDVARGETADNCGLAFSPDGQLIAFSTGQEAQLWNIGSGELVRRWPIPPGFVDSLAFPSTNGLYLLRREIRQGGEAPMANAPWQSYPRVCRLRNLLSSDPVRTVEDFNVSVVTARASGDGRFFGLEGVGESGNLRTRSIVVLEAASGRTVWRQESTNSQEWDYVFFSPESTRFGFTANGSDWWLLNLQATNELRRLVRQPNAIGPHGEVWTSWDPNGSPGHGVSLYRGAELLVTLGIYSNYDLDPQFDSTGRLLAWGNKDGTVNVCSLAEINRQLSSYGISSRLP
jgi:WD40 repeat protein